MQWFADDYLHQKYYPHNKFYRHYQDDVWGIPPHNDRSLFEQYTIAELGATSPIGDAVSKRMKKDGFRFAGPVSVYSFLGSIGIMDARPDGKGWEDDPKSLIKPYGEQGENTFDAKE